MSEPDRPCRQMGQPDALAVCQCGAVIDRQWWGNGGWLWVHRQTSRSECQAIRHASPVEGTIEELFA